jgi:hypothetical protein
MLKMRKDFGSSLDLAQFAKRPTYFTFVDVFASPSKAEEHHRKRIRILDIPYNGSKSLDWRDQNITEIRTRIFSTGNVLTGKTRQSLAGARSRK